VKWHILLLTLTALAGVVVAAALLAARQGAEFTAEEKRMLEGLAPILDTLAVQEEDLSSLPGNYEVCEGSGVYVLQYSLRSEDGSSEVEHVTRREADDHAFAYSALCDYWTGAYVSSIIELPDSKEDLLLLKRLDVVFEKGQEGDLHQLAEVISDDFPPEEELVDYRWVNAPGLGHTRYAWVRTVYNSLTGEELETYDFSFSRGMVMTALVVRLPSSPTAESEALLVAEALDNRIAAQVELLATQAQAQ
jgi:hypothetical protein